MRIILYIYLNIHIRFAKSISELILSTNNNDKSKRKRTVKVAFKEKSKILKITILTKRGHCFLSSVRQSLSSGVDKCVNLDFRINIIIFNLSFMNAVIFGVDLSSMNANFFQSGNRCKTIHSHNKLWAVQQFSSFTLNIESSDIMHAFEII